MRRRALLAGFATLAIAGSARAQNFPARSIRIVVPYAPGGGTDVLVRLILPDVANGLGQQVVVDNRPGGATVGGTDTVAKSPADGYTLLAADSTFLTNPGLMKNLPYQALRDFTAVTMMARAPVILVVHPSVPARNLGELLALAKARPGTLNFASGGNGASTHLAGELLKQVASIDMTHVPYKGTAPAMNDLVAGQVQMSFAGISTARQYVESGQLRALAVTGAKRNPALPDVPTFEESGIRGVDAESFWGLYAPAATPSDALTVLSQSFAKALKSAQHAQRLADLGYDPIANTPAEGTAQMKQMIANWAAVIEKAGIRVE